MIWEVFIQYLHTWITFSDLWKLVNSLCASIGVGDCEVNQSSWHKALSFMNVHLEAPLLMPYSAAFIDCVYSRLWCCIVSTWKRMRISGVIGEWFMHWTTTPVHYNHFVYLGAFQTHYPRRYRLPKQGMTEPQAITYLYQCKIKLL